MRYLLPILTTLTFHAAALGWTNSTFGSDWNWKHLRHLVTAARWDREIPIGPEPSKDVDRLQGGRRSRII